MSTNIGKFESYSMRKSVVIFRKKDGEIVHRHDILVLPDATSPSDDELKQEAMEIARGNLELSQEAANELDVLAVDSNTFKQRSEYRVDIRRRALVEVTSESK